jgi:hypothetical protein
MTITIGYATVTKITRDTPYVAVGGGTVTKGYHVAIPHVGGIYKAHCATRALAYRSAAAMTAMYARYNG